MPEDVHVGHQEKFLHGKSVKHWNGLPRKVMDPLQCSKNMMTWHLRPWFKGGHGHDAGLTAEFGDFKGLFQPS